MGSVTEVGRVHSIRQLCHLQRTEFKRWPKFDHNLRLYLRNWQAGNVLFLNSCDDNNNGYDGDHADEEDYPGDQLGGDLNVSSWYF